MAKWIEDGKKLLVEAGDTLSEIAQDFFGGVSNTDQLAALNGINNKDLIYIGQEINVSGSSGGSSSSSGGGGSTATINQFGLQSNSDNTLFATWTWDKSNTDKYEVEWCYDTGDSVWFIGNKGSTEDKQSTYNIPSNAKVVRFRVKPVSKTYTNDKQTAYYWTASWSTAKTYDTSNLPPEAPSTPSVEIDKYKLTATIDDINAKELNATGVQFQVIRDDSIVYATGKATINQETDFVSYSCVLVAGSKYKVRARSYNGNKYSDWSAYSGNELTIPSTPAMITTIKAIDKDSIRLEWPEITGAESYDVEYATKKEYFDRTSNTSTQSGIEKTYYDFVRLETGNEYFFRVRAVNSKGHSAWSEISSIAIGKKPSAPTTWSSTTNLIVGEKLILYWVHNSEDNSSQTWANLEITVGTKKRVIEIKNTEDEDKKDLTSFYEIDTTGDEYEEGVQIKWRVQTSGVLEKEWGDWSIERVVDIYKPPTLELSITDQNGSTIEVLEKFPIKVYALPGPNTQAPISYSLSISSNEIYETVDSIGNIKTVNKGELVYSKYFDISEELDVDLSAADVDLENNITYTLTCIVSMNSGLTAESSAEFTVAWTDESYQPNAEISFDNDSLVTHIKPYCEEYHMMRYKVVKEDTLYKKTENDIDVGVYGTLMKNAYTTTGEQVYYGTTADGELTYYCEVIYGTRINGVTLSVYRREFDGSFTELATGLANEDNTFITDPHPALDYARYRIVAITNSTGAVSYYDVPGFPIGEKAVVIQWDEEWSSFDVTNEDALEQPVWAGSLLKLPYNIDVSEKGSPDVVLVDYIGRKHPVSYYGTQIGETATWSMEVPKSDKETLYALRRLKAWMGDVYVREPSGTGYWAHINVSFSQKHLELTIPVSLDITRVEGGV